MAVKKALVITAGQIEQLQAGDRLDLGNIVTKTNNSGGALVIGQALFVTGTNADLAQANAQSTIRVAGLALAGAAIAAPVDILTDGILTATTGEWDAVTGDTGGLTPGSDYFLSAATGGGLTLTAPTAAGEFVVRVGHAVSTTELEIEIQQPIKL